MLIIGFGHKARQGKNTAAVVMLNASALDVRARIYAYADALRAEVKRAVNCAGGVEQLIKRGWIFGNDCSGKYLDTFKVTLPAWVVPEIGKPRTLLQWWGTDYRRAQDPDYWVKRMFETLDREQPDMALITDVRFRNEADAIHKAGGYLVKVTRIGKPDVNVPQHPSETNLDGYAGWDYEIKVATLAEMHQKSAAIYRKIAGKHGV